MAKISQEYELMTVYSLSKGEEAAKELVEKFKGLIEKSGTISNVDEWGKRKLAYLINDEAEGYYVVYTFTSAPDFPKELNRVLNITDGVLRSMLTLVND
jgi:small subunit ribosomal protein S6